MEFELWWLWALPLFFALGWLAARIDIQHVLRESKQLPRSYFRGLNFLINDQTDKAIDSLLEIIKHDDPETLDLSFVLGSLFRRRGELERAIRMHNSLLEREDLGEELRLRALHELAQDYHKAGLLDRAEEYFRRLLNTPYRVSSLVFLLQLYEQEREWLKAVEVARELAEEQNQPRHKEIAQFYCEQAAVEMAQSRTEQARDYLDKALASNRQCVRANVLLGDLYWQNGEADTALQYWRRIESQQPLYLHMVVERLLRVFRHKGQLVAGISLLRDYLQKYPTPDLLEALYQAVLESEGGQAAYALVRDELRRNPSLTGLDRLLEVQLMQASGEKQADLQLVKNLVHQHSRRVAFYRCGHCGFMARQFYWQCPACNNWETFPPRRKEEEVIHAG